MFDTTALRLATAHGVLALVAARFGVWWLAILLGVVAMGFVWLAWELAHAPVLE
jgi:hypothetical protein